MEAGGRPDVSRPVKLPATSGVRRAFAAGFLAALLAACGTPSTPVETAATQPATAPSAAGPSAPPAATKSAEPTDTPTATPRPTPGPEDWKTSPIVPGFSAHSAEILRRGISQGRNAHAFSKIGDCQNITTYFLADFESPQKFRLGPYADLQQTIDWFEGFFGRKSLAVRGGLNVASVMNPLMADPDSCQAGETPLACELRSNNPGLVLISFEEAWDGNVEKYETYLRKVIEYSINQGVVPVVATKADNLEGGDRINGLIARLAWEYDIPLWNFWSAVQPLPYHGLSRDGFHLTQRPDYHNYYFDLPSSKWSGWMMRNLTALQVLDAARAEILSPAVG
jgi:hypothetical protein